MDRFQKDPLIRKLVWYVSHCQWAGYGSVQGDAYSHEQTGLIICRNVLKQTVKLFIILHAFLQKADFVGFFGFFGGLGGKQLGLGGLVLGWFSTQIVTPCMTRSLSVLICTQLLGFLNTPGASSSRPLIPSHLFFSSFLTPLLLVVLSTPDCFSICVVRWCAYYFICKFHGGKAWLVPAIPC